jgi:hypothetical protein
MRPVLSSATERVTIRGAPPGAKQAICCDGRADCRRGVKMQRRRRMIDRALMRSAPCLKKKPRLPKKTGPELDSVRPLKVILLARMTTSTWPS